MASKSTEQPAEQTGMHLRETKPVPGPDGSAEYVSVPQPTEPQVQYVGYATERILDVEDWQTLQVTDTKDLRRYCWDLSNNKMIPKSSFSPQQLDYLLNKDDRFVLWEPPKEG